MTKSPMELYKRKLITEITKANIELMQIRIRTFRNKCDSYNKGKVKYYG